MSDFKIPDGKHPAKVIDYGIGETKAGDPQVMVRFKLTMDGSEINWYGSLKDGKPQEFTFTTLQKVLGMKGDDLLRLEGGSGSGTLDEEKTVELVIATEEWQGKTSTKVKWVNDYGASKAKKSIDQAVSTKLKSLNASFKAYRKITGASGEEDLGF